MPDTFELIATTGFGLEAVVSRELKALGYQDQTVTDGRVAFRGDAAAIARTNLWLRSAGRVLWKVAEFEASDFDVLFETTKALPWADWLPEDASFPVNGRSAKSQLSSVPTCQAVTKKAIVESLKSRYQRAQFAETGPEFPVEVSLLRDVATLTIDTSGIGLHKRGYRTLTGEAPLRETIAAGLIQLSYWNRDRAFADPLCGTGTIAIEAALIGRNMAPGLHRSFAAEDWPFLPTDIWKQAREEARDLIQPPIALPLIATDQNANALKLGRHNAQQAGVEESIHFQQRSLADFSSSHKYGCLICNPPYGERLSERHEVVSLYEEMGRVLRPLETWSLYVLGGDRQFEKPFGRKADRRRKLFNAQIECTYYQFQGPRPPRS